VAIAGGEVERSVNWSSIVIRDHILLLNGIKDTSLKTCIHHEVPFLLSIAHNAEARFFGPQLLWIEHGTRLKHLAEKFVI
jgi:hypothetical protein